MRFPVPVFLCLALLLLCSSVWAEDQKEKPPEWASYFVLEEVLMRGSDDAALKTSHAVAKPTLILETTKDGDTKVKARLGMEFGMNGVLELQVESPQSKPSERRTLATLDGLTNSSTAEVGFTWIHWDPYYLGYEALAPSKAETSGANDNPQTLDKMDPKGVERRLNSYSDSRLLRPSAMAAMGPDNYRSALDAARSALQEKGNKIPIFLTVRAKVGPEEFNFLNASTLKSDKESHSSRLFTTALGTYVQGSFYGSLSYSRGTTFIAGPTKNLCTPFGSINAIECRNVTVGPPTEAKAETVKFELRKLFGSIGFAAQLTRDLKNNVTGIEVPIYFLQQMGMSGMELNGGIAINWRSDTRDYAVSAFIGPALSTGFRKK